MRERLRAASFFVSSFCLRFLGASGFRQPPQGRGTLARRLGFSEPERNATIIDIYCFILVERSPQPRAATKRKLKSGCIVPLREVKLRLHYTCCPPLLGPSFGTPLPTSSDHIDASESRHSATAPSARARLGLGRRDIRRDRAHGRCWGTSKPRRLDRGRPSRPATEHDPACHLPCLVGFHDRARTRGSRDIRFHPEARLRLPTEIRELDGPPSGLDLQANERGWGPGSRVGHARDPPRLNP